MSDKKKEDEVCILCKYVPSLPIVSLLKYKDVFICKGCLETFPVCISCGLPKNTIDKEAMDDNFVEYNGTNWCSLCFHDEEMLLMYLMGKCMKKYVDLDAELISRRKRKRDEMEERESRKKAEREEEKEEEEEDISSSSSSISLSSCIFNDDDKYEEKKEEAEEEDESLMWMSINSDLDLFFGLDDL